MGSGSIRAAWVAAALLLAGCGGGGGGGAGTELPGPSGEAVPSEPEIQPSGPSWLSFEPGRVTVEAEAGTSPAFSVLATSGKLIAERINIAILDNGGVVIPQSTSITALSSTQYRATFWLSPALAAKTYQGSFTVKLCLDAPQTCANPYPGSPWTVPYTIVVKPRGLAVVVNVAPSFSYLEGQPATQAASVTVQGTGQQWSLKSAPSWAVLDKTGGTLPTTIGIVARSGMAPGRYSDDVVIATAEGQRVAIPVSLEVQQPGTPPAPAPGTTSPPVASGSWSVDAASLTFSAVNGAPIGARAVTVTAAGTPDWVATSSAPWLVLYKAGSTLTVNPDPRLATLASGNHAATITLASPTQGTRTIPVSLALTRATISATSDTLLLGGSRGRDLTSRSIGFALNTGGAGHSWQLSAAPAWVVATAASGLNGQSTTSFTITPNAAMPGTQTGQLVITASVNGDVVTKTVSLAASIDQRKLLFSETGVALTSTPQWSRLSRSLAIRDNFGGQTAWTAQSDQAWLTVTGSGTTDTGGRSAFTIQAVAAALPNDTISIATVTLTPQGGGITSPEKLVVGLWKGSGTPATTVSLPVTYTNAVADPVRPYLYVNSSGSSVDVFHIYRQSKIATIAGMGGALGPMAVSPDGTRLYAMDLARGTVAVADLTTQAALAPQPVAQGVGHNIGVAYARPNGVGVILLGDQSAYTAAPWQLAQAMGSAVSPAVATQPDGSRVAYVGTMTYDIDYFAGRFASIENRAATSAFDSRGLDVALSTDGSRLYTAEASNQRCAAWNAGDGRFVGTLPGVEGYPSNVATSPDGRVFCGVSGTLSASDIWMFGPAGDLRATWRVTGMRRGLLAQQLVISGDGLMAAALTDDPSLVFIPVGP